LRQFFKQDFQTKKKLICNSYNICVATTKRYLAKTLSPKLHWKTAVNETLRNQR